ncbi:MAG: bifunctional metallophosphatase/5'-nucleotidase [Acidimicrobiia bacterium]|nr:bifunctional metallophosphatase/5'-nucleotidase [Acidimicrobiia bacterium]MDH5294360.1 bifunctional metallophosphatase/5'-nucleotidase [Acidimicrobiia bacterium]
MKHRLRLLLGTVLGVSLLAMMALPAGASRGAEQSQPVQLQILAINDFHGQLTPVGTLGGADALGAYLRAAEVTNPNTTIVSAGDLIGASPLISALFHDEPTIEAMNMIGLDINAVGNHEFDEGTDELLRMQNGGPHPVDGDLDGTPFPGADFQFLAANVVSETTGKTLFPPYTIKNYQGVRVAYIGMTLEGTPTIVTPSGVAGYDFLDEADTVNALVDKLKKINIEAIVVLVHEGGVQTLPGGANDCNGISGPIVDIVERTSDEVDLFITGHTHQNYNCIIDGRPVTSARSISRVFTDIDVELNRVTKEMTVKSINNVATDRAAITPAQDIADFVSVYAALSAPLANRVIGVISADITRTQNAAGESALGDVIADAQLAATAPAGFGEAVAAFMNPGGIRADLTYLASGTEADGEVTYGESFTVQPFGNSLVTMTLTGAQIDTLLEQQFDNPTPGASRMLQVSQGFTYAWSASAPTGSKVDIASIMINGVPIDPNGTYRVTVNSFLASGGDNFAVLVQGTDNLGGDVDLDALEDYFQAQGTVDPGPQNRITQLP